MSEPRSEKTDQDAWLPEAADESYGLPLDIVYAVQDALEAGETAVVRGLIEDLHSADLADLLESLGGDERKALVHALGNEIDTEALSYLDESVLNDIIEELEPKNLAKSLSELDSDDAVEVLEELDEDVRHRIISALPQAYRALIEESLTFPENSAGRLMQRELAVVPTTWTVGETIDFMRASDQLPDDFYDLYIVDPKHNPVGWVPVSRVLRTRRPVDLTEIMEEDMKTIMVDMDQEDVAYVFRQYGLYSAPVLDNAGRLVGTITLDDVVHIIDEEAEEDIMKLGGVSETDIFSDLKDTAKARGSWLVVNLITAIIASAVIGLFEATIEQIVALAVLMPIVASMGGNAGTQTLTVAVRAIAMKDLSAANAKRFIGKEVLVGVINGVLFAVLAGAVAWLWFGSQAIGVIIGAAMIINMIVAGLSGTLIPLSLERFGVDPAVASSVLRSTSE